MDVVRTQMYEGEELTIIEDEQGFNIIPIEYMKKIAKELLYTCKKLTEEDLLFINKQNVLDRHTGMFPQKYGEDDPMWIEFERNYIREPIVKPPRKKLKGHVYFLKCCDTNLYKIGYSTSVKTRLKDIKNGSPTTIEIIGYVASTDCFTDKEYYHEIFKNKRVKGEWFTLTNDDINNIEGLLYDNEI